MHTSGNQPTPYIEEPEYRPQSEGDGQDSDFEIEDNALLGTREGVAHYKEKFKEQGTQIWQTIYGYIHSTPWGRKAEDYMALKSNQSTKRTLFITVAIIMLLTVIISFTRGSRIHRTLLLPKNPFCRTSTEPGSEILPRKPKGFKIYGLVFYGRRHTVEILDCYLRQNLVKNGGWLDEVHFLINTPVEADRDWISDLLPKVPEYRGIYMADDTDMRDFESVWRQGLQHSTDDLYVKFDDDLVYMSPTSVEEVVTSLLTHPEAFLVLANLVNGAALGWLHHHHGAIDSYLPELTQPSTTSESYGPKAWRNSKLPTYTPPSTTRPFFNSDEDWDRDAPYPNHRWLPLRDNQTLLPLTPIWRTEYDANSFDWNHWQLGAQQHYSLLSHLEPSPPALHKYAFGDPHTGLWNMRFMHANINFMAVWANDILENLPFSVDEDDEAHFSITLPREKKRQCYIQTRAVASHFSFGPQGGMYETDLLARYRAYANEHVCKEVGVKLKSTEEWPGPKKKEGWWGGGDE